MHSDSASYGVLSDRHQVSIGINPVYVRMCVYVYARMRVFVSSIILDAHVH